MKKGKMLLTVKETLDAKRNCTKMELDANTRGPNCYRQIDCEHQTREVGRVMTDKLFIIQNLLKNFKAKILYLEIKLFDSVYNKVFFFLNTDT